MQWIPGDISNLTFKKPGMFGNISSRKLKDSCEICSAILKNIWNFEFKKKYFPDNLILADIIHFYRKIA